MFNAQERMPSSGSIMLKWMKLKNLALVSEAEIEFSPSFNVITGETGAGKSVIMGALSLLLGERADKSAIRTGCSRCELDAEFHIPGYAKKNIETLLENAGAEVNDDSTLFIKRVMTQGSTRNFINNSSVSLSVLKEIRSMLIDVHAASENQILLKSQEQLAALDRFADAEPELEQTARAWNKYLEAKKERTLFLSSMPSGNDAAILKKDIESIERINPYPNEDEELKTKHIKASNAVSLISAATNVSGLLTEGEDSLADRTGLARRMMAELEKNDPENTAHFVELIENISDNIRELSDALGSYACSIELDEGEFAALEERMRLIQSLKRKFGPDIEDVLAHLQEMKKSLDNYENAENIREKLEANENAALKKYSDTANILSLKRHEASSKLVALLEKEMRNLALPSAKFGIEFEKTSPGPAGNDKIEFMFSANVGVETRSLRQVASSGEISRVLLALKTILADADAVPILVFDEIDANIGGETASKVAAELAKLGQHKQIISISHLAQTATLADRHFLVSKTADNAETFSTIRELQGEERVSELGRMLGGDEAAVEHARSILSKTKELKTL